MKIMYIDSQNVHKAIEMMGWIIDRDKFYTYSKEKFGLDKIKFFVGYLEKHQKFYEKLNNIGYEIVFKKAAILPNGLAKGNVDIDIAISSLIDFYENGLWKAYLFTGDGDFNTLVELFHTKGILGRVLIPNRQYASSLLKRAAGPNIQSIQDIKFLLEKFS